jgi:hypothetical protein
MVQQTDDGSLPGCSDFFGVVGSFAVGGALVLVLGLSGYDLDGGLLQISTSVGSFLYFSLTAGSTGACAIKEPMPLPL